MAIKGLVETTRRVPAVILLNGLSVNPAAELSRHFARYTKNIFNKNSKIACMGIVPWGDVMDRDQLEGLVPSEVKEYKPDSWGGYLPIISENLDHFIFSDDGYRNFHSAAAHADFRVRLEEQWSTDVKGESFLLLVVA